MQKSWRTDADKLTFIACTSPPVPPPSFDPGIFDSPESMIGDVNLFLNADNDEIKSTDWCLANTDIKKTLEVCVEVFPRIKVPALLTTD